MQERDKNQPIQDDDRNNKGRTDKGDQKRDDPEDRMNISSIDRQEGNLEHGETGGNFRDQPNERS